MQSQFEQFRSILTSIHDHIVAQPNTITKPVINATDAAANISLELQQVQHVSQEQPQQQQQSQPILVNSVTTEQDPKYHPKQSSTMKINNVQNSDDIFDTMADISISGDGSEDDADADAISLLTELNIHRVSEYVKYINFKYANTILQSMQLLFCCEK